MTGVFVKNVIETVKKHNMLENGDHVLAAVSGGADSVALLYALLEIQQTFSLDISVCHINHNLRGKDSQKDEEYVRKLCESLNLPLFCYSVDVETAKQGHSLEEAARNVRYAHFYKCGIKKIALGHNLNDNAETLLLRLCRGTGLSGLGGIPPVRKGEYTIIRPLIETSRASIEDFLQKKGVDYRTDQSNFDINFSRNRIRHDVLPVLQKINPQAIKNLAKSAELLRKDGELLSALNGQSTRIHIPTIHRHVIHAVLSQTEGLRDVTQKHITQIESLISAKSGKEIHLPGGFCVRREYDYLLIVHKNDLNYEGFSLEISLNSPVFVPATGQFVQFSVKNSDINSYVNSSEICTKYFNYDKIILSSLKLRSRMPGDCIYISGVGRKKLSDEFSDRKIPKSMRDSIPLLAQDNDILWIIDGNGRVSDAYKPEAGRKVLAVEVLKDERDN